MPRSIVSIRPGGPIVMSCPSENERPLRRPGQASSVIIKAVDVMGFVTAGGRSSRMGRDKAWLELGGRPMIAHVLDALRPVVTDIAVIANRDEYGALGVQIVPDTNRGIGPIEAVRTS